VRQLLKIRDVADLTGVGYNTVIEWVKSGLPTIRPVGRRSHLIDPDDLETFLQRHKSSTERNDSRDVRGAEVGTRIGTGSQGKPMKTGGNQGITWYGKYLHKYELLAFILFVALVS
jgi:excisionase family DNA binding protein